MSIIIRDYLFIHHQAGGVVLVVCALFSALFSALLRWMWSIEKTVSTLNTTDTGKKTSWKTLVWLLNILFVVVGCILLAGLIGVIERIWFDNGGYAVFG